MHGMQCFCRKWPNPTPEEQTLNKIVVICPTIGGHSGGPCVNQQGEVIGILSRADPADRQRCYLVPSSEWLPLVKTAKKLLSRPLNPIVGNGKD